MPWRGMLCLRLRFIGFKVWGGLRIAWLYWDHAGLPGHLFIAMIKLPQKKLNSL